jgi:hypothetical protein
MYLLYLLLTLLFVRCFTASDCPFGIIKLVLVIWLGVLETLYDKVFSSVIFSGYSRVLVHYVVGNKNVCIDVNGNNTQKECIKKKGVSKILNKYPDSKSFKIITLNLQLL